MTDQPWGTDNDRQIFVRALARFSDDCAAPELTPECPFYEETQQGPVCAEQCKDLLDQYPQDLVRADATAVGIGLEAIRRPRPRRGPEKDERAFDAREIRLTEGGPVHTWRTSSLIVELKDRALQPPVTSPDGDIDIDSVCTELQQRGVDVEVLVRYGLSNDRVAGMVVQLATTAQEGGTSALVRLAEEFTVRRGEAPSVGEGAHRVSHWLSAGLWHALVAWSQTAPTEQLLEGQRPSRLEELLDLEEPVFGGDLVDEQIWLIERFTETYLESWSPASLRQEWRYIHSLRRGCCPAALMRERRVDAGALSGVLADLSCLEAEHQVDRETDSELSNRRDPIHVASFTSIAVKNLNAGRRADAVAIYRGLVELRPDDAEARNNLAFCLIPDDPASAVREFELCIRMAGDDAQAMNFLNLALAAHRAGDNTEAAEALKSALGAETLWAPALMWDPNIPGGRVVLYEDLNEYARILEMHIAACHGSCASAAS